MSRKMITLAAVLAAGTLSASGAHAAGVDGVWLSEDGEGIVEIGACASDASAKCGRIVWIKSPLGDDGKPVRDSKNSDPALQKRQVCGLEVVSGMKPEAGGGFAGGTVYDPQEGKAYKGSLQAEGDVLKITGYVETPVLGKLSDSDKLTKVVAPFERCKVK